LARSFGCASGWHLRATLGTPNFSSLREAQSYIFCLTCQKFIPIHLRSPGIKRNLLGQKKEQKMGIKNLSKDVLLVVLPSKGPKIAHELKAVNETVSKKKGNRDVVIDFSRVEIINSANISNLLILHNLLQNSGHRLIFCNVATVTKCIFVVAGLDKVFDFSDDQPAVLAAVHDAD